MLDEAQRTAALDLIEANKKRRLEAVNTATGDDIKHINDQLALLNDDLAAVSYEFNQIDERLKKLEGMAKFCYAICNNDAIKRIADEAPARRSFGSRVFGNRQGGGQDSGFRPTPGGYMANKGN